LYSYAFSVFQLSQPTVATLIRYGEQSSYCHMCCSFCNLRVKADLKSFYFWRSYRQK